MVRNGLSEIQKRNFQWIIISAFISVFCWTALFSSIRPPLSLAKILIPAIVFTCITIALAIRQNKKGWCKPAPLPRLFWLLVGVYFLLLLADIAVAPIWDAGLYYTKLIQSVQSFEFIASSFLSSFSAYRHPTHMLFLLYAPGQYLFPGSVVSLNFTTLVLSIAMLISYYRLMESLFKKQTRQALAATALFAFMPSVFCYSTGISPDYGVLVGLVFFLSCYTRGYTVWAVWGALLMLFSKEPGSVLYMGFCLGVLLFELIPECKEEGLTSGFVRFVRRRWYLLLPLIAAVLYYFVLGGFGEALSRRGVPENGGLIRDWGFDIAHIRTVMSQIFILNFAWILSGLFLIGGVTFLRKKTMTQSDGKKQWKEDTPPIVKIILVSLGCYFLFCLFYSEIALLRYNIPLIAALPPLAVWGAQQFLPVLKINRLVLGGLTVLLMISSYWLMDPLSYLVFPHRIQPGKALLLNVSNDPIYQDLCEVNLYNRQYLNYSRLLDDVIKKYGVSEDCPYYGWDVQPFSFQFFGNDESIYRLQYSPSKDRRVFYAADGEEIPGREIFAWQWEEEFRIDPKGLWLQPAYHSREIPEELESSVTQQEELSRGGFTMRIWVVESPVSSA